jgi:NAD+ synthase (glutamine-hydrolysing)
VFDGHGNLCGRAPAFEEANPSITVEGTSVSSDLTPEPESVALIYQALVMGLRDYVTKNKCPGVLLGLSGGVDSALTLAIAVDALGADRVTAVLMPSQYSADISRIDALAQAHNLAVNTHLLPIDPSFKTLLSTLEPVIGNQSLGITAENLQARIRGVLLMALSNQTGYMLLSTSNKSEMAVGYSTIYGDMCGGYAVIKDVLKTRVYDLARYRNRQQAVIPERVLTRAPSAELAPNQTDQDSLPDYATLDAIIQGYVEQTLSYEQLLEAGYSEDTVALTLRLIKRNEYKRHQAPPGTKISPCAFGRDWRYPLTQQFHEKVPVASCKIHTSR